MTIEIDGVLRYSPEDAQAGVCEPHQVWRPVPGENALPATAEQAGSPPTAEQMRKDVLAAYKELGGVKFLTALAGDNPPAFLKLLVGAIHQTDAAAVDYTDLSREEHRLQQIASCDAIIAAHRAASNAGDAKASEVIIKAEDRKAKLVGSDQPRLIATFDAGRNLATYTDAELHAIVQRGEEERRQGASPLTLQQGEDGTYTDGN